MTRTTLVSVVGVLMACVLLASCIAPGLAVRAGLAREILFSFPPESRYQVIVRVGSDAQPWDRRGGRPAAVNMWVHDRDRERWHLLQLVRIPLGGQTPREPGPSGRPPFLP